MIMMERIKGSQRCSMWMAEIKCLLTVSSLGADSRHDDKKKNWKKKMEVRVEGMGLWLAGTYGDG